MVQKYCLEGLECANCAICADCAAAIQRETQSWSDVKNASLDLNNNKLVVDTETDAKDFMARLVQCVARVEPKIRVSFGDAAVCVPGCGCGHEPLLGHIHEQQHEGHCSCGINHVHEQETIQKTGSACKSHAAAGAKNNIIF